jgi:hypothetical protein
MLRQIFLIMIFTLLVAGCGKNDTKEQQQPPETDKTDVAAGEDAVHAEEEEVFTCLKEEFFTVVVTKVWKIEGREGFFFEAGMQIDADGAPDAYHPENKGTDFLANAGEPGNWWALATDKDGNPVIQGPNDPNPGYYVSTTALEDRTKEVTDPQRYVNSNEIPYLVLPGKHPSGAKLGDFGVAINKTNGKICYAIFADIGPKGKIGEGSIALARELELPSSPKRGGTDESIIWYLIFPNSGNGKPRPLSEINSEGEKLFEAWGGLKQLETCFTDY